MLNLRLPWRALALLLAALPGLPAYAQGAAGAEARLPTLTAAQLHELVPQLRAGGHVIFFRHTTTRLGQEDRPRLDLGDCASQRNLSDQGRREAVAIGEAMRKLGIPVGRVIASPFCRTRETAQLAFGGKSVERSDELYFASGLPRKQRALKGQALRRMLGEAPAAGGNTVLVSHTANLVEAIGIWPKPEGVAIVIRPDGRGAHAVVGRILPQTWGLAAQGIGRP